MRVISKTGKLLKNDEEVYQFLSDFRNFESFIPAEHMQDFKAEEDQCSFKVQGFTIELHTVEKEPNKLLKVQSSGGNPVPFTMWLQLKSLEEMDTRVRVTMEAELNAMMKMVIGKQLQKAADAMVDHMELYFNKPA